MYSLAELGDVPRESAQFPEFDYKRLGEETAKAMEGMGIYLNEEKVGEVITPSVNNNMGIIEMRRR